MDIHYHNLKIDDYENIHSANLLYLTIHSAIGHFKEKNYSKTGINTDDDLPLNKPLKFPTLTIIIKCVFHEGEKLHPQIYLDECLYEL